MVKLINEKKIINGEGVKYKNKKFGKKNVNFSITIYDRTFVNNLKIILLKQVLLIKLNFLYLLSKNIRSYFTHYNINKIFKISLVFKLYRKNLRSFYTRI